MKIFLSTALLFILLSSCQELTADFNNPYDSSPATISTSLAFNLATEKTLTLQWTVNVNLIPQQVADTHDPQFILEKCPSAGTEFVPVDTAEVPFILELSSGYTSCQSVFKVNNTQNEINKFRIKSIYKGNTTYSNELNGMITLTAPYNLSPGYDAAHSILRLGIYAYTISYYTSSAQYWHLRKGVKVYMRKYNAGEEYRLLGTVEMPSSVTYMLYTVPDFNTLTPGTTYQFAVSTYSETKESTFRTMTWTYPSN